MKASDLFVKALEKEGVEYIFGVPGEENLDFLDSLRNSSIKLIVTRHEQAAGFMAATVGRLTGKPGVCLSTLGPGATNFVTAAAYAKLGGMPMMMITGQKPIRKSKQGQFQIVKVVPMMRPITQYSELVVDGYRLPSMIREAFRIAMQERPGPVHIELPEDVAAEEVEHELFEVRKPRRAIAEAKAIAEAVDLIQKAKHPLILIGAGANRKTVQKMLTEFIEKTKIPFFDTQMGKGVVDERHELFLGTAALSANDFLHCAIDKADVIINIGHDVIEKPPFIMNRDGQKVIHVNFFEAVVDDVYFPQYQVVGDIANAVWQITEMLESQSHWDFAYFLETKERLEKHHAEKMHADNFPMLPQRIVNDVREILPSDSILALDNGMYKLWFARQYKAHEPNSILLDNALATMGAGLPSAMAAKLLHPEKRVVAIAGDGGFMMNSQELETAVRMNLNLTVIVLNDNAYGMIKWKQEGSGFTDFGLDYANPDFVKYAEAYGANGYRVKKAEDFQRLLKETADKSGVHLIEVPIDYSENQIVFTKLLNELSCSI